MSETEKRQRAEYQKKRTRQIYIRSVVLICLAVAVLICGTTANQLSQSSYVTYNERGSVEYQVYLKDNQFYKQEYLTADYAYIAVLVDHIQTQFNYSMRVDGRAEYEYSYYMDAQLLILDKDSGAALYDPVYTLVEPVSGKSTESALELTQEISLDFHSYDAIAREYVTTYGLQNPTCQLVVTLHTVVDGTCPNVADGQGKFDVSLTIPLNKSTLKAQTNTTVPKLKVMACSTRGAQLLKVLTIVLGSVAVLWAVLLVVYVIRTRDRHINYARQVKKIMSSYKSYIQCIRDPIDTSGYQVLHLGTFTELLEIHDTLRLPILMYEDDDRTCTKFMILTDAGFIYCYEIVVAGVQVQV